MGDGTTKKPTYINVKLSLHLKAEVIKVLKEFIDCFSWDYDETPGLSHDLVELKLSIILDKKPVKQTPRRFAPEIMSKINVEIERFLQNKFIKPVRYVEWLANIVQVTNKMSPSYSAYALEILTLLLLKTNIRCQWLRCWSIWRKDSNTLVSLMDTLVTTDFHWRRRHSKNIILMPRALGTYEWVMMPFGLKNASATYQRVMNSMFHDFIETFMQVYIDDIVIKSSSENSHLDHLQQSFERMRKRELKMNPSKCDFYVHAWDFLGFVVH